MTTKIQTQVQKQIPSEYNKVRRQQRGVVMLRGVALVAGVVFSLTGFAAAQRDFPRPGPAVQAGIDKDNTRHFGSAPADGGPMAKDLSVAIRPADIDKAVRKVADWQLKESEPYFDRIWTWSVLYTGFLAASRETGDPKYRDAMLAMSRKYNFELRNRLPNADDQSVGSTYLELYLNQPATARDGAWISPTKNDLDSVIGLATLKPGDAKIPWWWCDALFMAPAVWAEMARATGDHKYVDYLHLNWQRTYDLLWDPDEHLYARDASYKAKREANGRKIFWSRGEGWVLGGLARTLEALPADDPKRGFYEQNMREMAAKVASLQGADGLWHAGLLDPASYPLPEVSGSALFTYGMAWGINHGVLDRAKYTPVVTRAWAGMLQHIYADGRLGDIQQTGPEPAIYYPTSSYTYGVGGFLLAGSEMKVLAGGQIQPTFPPPQQAAQTPSPTDPAATARDLHLPVPANPRLASLILVGDSTVRNGHGDGVGGQWGWGDELAPFFDSSKINVVNRAIGGRSSKSYISEGQWALTLALIKPGDTVLFQWGHNDGGKPDDPSRARASLPGTGPETVEIENPVLHKHETVHTYGWYLDRYVADTRAKGATPIICSLIPRKTWRDGKIVRNKGDYAGWGEQVATKDQVGFIDLNERIAAVYDGMGESAVEPLFADPHTHTSLEGAKLNAKEVVAGLKGLAKDPVAGDFSALGAAVKP